MTEEIGQKRKRQNKIKRIKKPSGGKMEFQLVEEKKKDKQMEFRWCRSNDPIQLSCERRETSRMGSV